MSHRNQPTILLIEADTSLRRLITFGLQQRGLHVIAAASSDTIPPLEARQPDLLLLDIDHGTKSSWSTLQAAQVYTQLTSLPTVVLTWEGDGRAALPAATAVAPSITYLPKPFDARILHHIIDQILSASAAKAAIIEAETEKTLLAAYASHAAPSIWPIITAIGLLITVIGLLLLQVAIAAAGFIIVLVSLLLWTLSPRTRSEAPQIAVS